MNSMELAWRAYEDAVDMYAERKFHEVVLPFCKKRNWEFVAGNGVWWIGPVGGRHMQPLKYPEDEEFQEVVAELTVEISGMFANDLGSLMPDYFVGVDLEQEIAVVLR